MKNPYWLPTDPQYVMCVTGLWVGWILVIGGILLLIKQYI